MKATEESRTIPFYLPPGRSLRTHASLRVDKYATPAFAGLVFLGMCLLSLHNVRLFHHLTQIFIIVVGCSIFIIAWNSRYHLDNHYLLFLGIAFLFISLFMVLHAMALQGEAIINHCGPNLSAQTWIASRAILSLSMLSAPLFLNRRIRIPHVFAAFLGASLFFLALIHHGLFPTCYADEGGLTGFKKACAVALAMVFVAAAVFLFSKRESFEPVVFRCLAAALVLSAITEIIFINYAYRLDGELPAGHVLMLLSFYFIYTAIVETGLQRPHLLLFQRFIHKENELKKALSKMEYLAVTDPLTGLYNRRYFTEMAEYEIIRSRRYRHCFSAILLDIDHFKTVNDLYGHTAGDQVLERVADCCRQELRDIDIIGRYGGDEIMIILPESDLNNATRVAERLRIRVGRISLDTDAGKLAVTASFGITMVRDETVSLETVINRADQSLYKAKQAGRNTVGGSC